MAKTQTEKSKTPTVPVTALGKIWAPGEQLTEAAAARIDDNLLADYEPSSSSPDVAVEAGQEWYDGRTIKSVIASVGDDAERAKYAREREDKRDKTRQREGVYDYLDGLKG